MPAKNPAEMSARTMLLLAGLGALLVAVVLAACLVMRGGAGHTARPLPVSPVSAGTRVVPPVVGIDYQDAEKLLADQGLAVATVVRVPSARHADTVVRTYPDSGVAVPPGGRVTIYVSGH